MTFLKKYWYIFERIIIAILAIGWLVKMFLWFTPLNVLAELGIDRNYIVLDAAASMLLGGTLFMIIWYQRQWFSSQGMFIGLAVAAGGLATIQLLVLLLIGIAAKYFGFGAAG